MGPSAVQKEGPTSTVGAEIATHFAVLVLVPAPHVFAVVQVPQFV
jgi:hypothetical protein